MKSPVKNKIKTVFIPVSDIKKAKEWYTEMLGIDEGEFMFDNLFAAKMDGAEMVLDTMPMWRDENEQLQPLNVPAIQFGTDDIQASYNFMKAKGIELVTEVQHNHWFVFKDPDGNKLMVCQEN